MKANASDRSGQNRVVNRCASGWKGKTGPIVGWGSVLADGRKRGVIVPVWRSSAPCCCLKVVFNTQIRSSSAEETDELGIGESRR